MDLDLLHKLSHPYADKIPYQKTRRNRGYKSRDLPPPYADLGIRKRGGNPTEEKDDYEREYHKSHFVENFGAGVFGPCMFLDNGVSGKSEGEVQGKHPKDRSKKWTYPEKYNRQKRNRK